jgi:hypothetical protein
MDLLQSIQEYANSLHAELKEKNGIYSLAFTVAERKAFLSTQKLTYEAKMRIDTAGKMLKFTESLREASAGIQAGAGFQVETYSTGKGGQREGGIQQQSDQFGKKYEYKVDFRAVRTKIEALAKEADFAFQYQITSLDL